MPSYRLSERVLRDLEDIWSFIAEKNEAAADSFIDRIIQTFELLGNNPYAGRSREDLRPGYRSFPVGLKKH